MTPLQPLSYPESITPAVAVDDLWQPQPDNLWLRGYQPDSTAPLRLICCSYAGSGASIFRPWATELPAAIAVCAVQLPGREDRLDVPPATQLLDLVKTLARELAPYLDRPFALFGHSMGALLSFELARELYRIDGRNPVHLFVSSSFAPQTFQANSTLYQLPDREFLELLRTLNGTPEELLQNSDLMKFLMPILRADFALIETYQYTPELPLSCPITAFGGQQDPYVLETALMDWQKQTTHSFTVQTFAGDHFFLNHDRQPLLTAIAQTLGDF